MGSSSAKPECVHYRERHKYLLVRWPYPHLRWWTRHRHQKARPPRGAKLHDVNYCAHRKTSAFAVLRSTRAVTLKCSVFYNPQGNGAPSALSRRVSVIVHITTFSPLRCCGPPLRSRRVCLAVCTTRERTPTARSSGVCILVCTILWRTHAAKPRSVHCIRSCVSIDGEVIKMVLNRLNCSVS